ncbi:DNA adenine methylase [Candidatus Woesearchaeota archaeon]|nr:DNA adenine methylase [Candidatus Woesearchaeota archaeon]
MKNNIPSFVKWAGGKKQLIGQFEKFFPSKFERYFEPFVGGGAVAFHILKNYSPKEAFLFDINKELINCYNTIKQNPQELLKDLQEHKDKHNKEYFYQIRSKSLGEMNKLERAARFIYLNRTCFNGLYRVNSKGIFNVPMGDYKNPLIVPKEDITEISSLLKKASLKCSSFEKVLNLAKKGDFVYLDPPYYPLKKGTSFTAYTQGNFLEKEQIKLQKVFSQLNKKGCKVMLSNSDTEFITDIYKSFHINKVRATRMINCNGNERGKITEVVITNY